MSLALEIIQMQTFRFCGKRKSHLLEKYQKVDMFGANGFSRFVNDRQTGTGRPPTQNAKPVLFRAR